MSRYRKLSLDFTCSLFAPVATPIGRAPAAAFNYVEIIKETGKRIRGPSEFPISDGGLKGSRASSASATTVSFSRAVIGKQRLFPARVLLVSVSLLRREASLCPGYLITRRIGARERVAAARPSIFLFNNESNGNLYAAKFHAL